MNSRAPGWPSGAWRQNGCPACVTSRRSESIGLVDPHRRSDAERPGSRAASLRHRGRVVRDARRAGGRGLRRHDEHGLQGVGTSSTSPRTTSGSFTATCCNTRTRTSAIAAPTRRSPTTWRHSVPAARDWASSSRPRAPFDTPRLTAGLLTWTRKGLARPADLHPLAGHRRLRRRLPGHPSVPGRQRAACRGFLTTLLLLRAGYSYVPYCSLESVIERSRDAYYLALRRTQKTLRTPEPDWDPWLAYFLTALQRQKRHLHEKIQRERLTIGDLPELSLRILEIAREQGRVTIRAAVAATGASRNTIKDHVRGVDPRRPSDETRRRPKHMVCARLTPAGNRTSRPRSHPPATRHIADNPGGDVRASHPLRRRCRIAGTNGAEFRVRQPGPAIRTEVTSCASRSFSP